MNSLRQKIEQEIRERGALPFSRYMDLCLYDPELGYYSRHAEQFGKAGDFYTASDVHAVFGRLLARQFEEMWRALGSPEQIHVVELGPGRGLFARDVLDWSERKFPDFFRALSYILVEQSSALRQRLEITLSEHFDSGKARLGSASTTEGTRLVQRLSVADDPASIAAALVPEGASILFANEFFDALPVEVVSDKGSLSIDSREHRFVETWAPSSPEVLAFLDRYSIHPESGERLEVPLTAQHYAGRVFPGIEHGFAVIIDYGYTRDEQLAGRHRGTLKAIRQHSISTTPYEAPGEQDITSDVNFTALAASAEKHGMQTHKLITQSQFLLGIGEANQFADAFEECRIPQERAKVALQLKHLVTPAGMGENFQVLVARKGVAGEKVTALAGLGFGTP